MSGGGRGAEAPLWLIWGEDDFAVQRRGREVFERWQKEVSGGDVEVIAGDAVVVEEAMRVMGRVREALNTLPFFGGTKLVWMKGCTFAGEGRLSEAASVVEALGGFGRELAAFRWSGVRLLITAGKVDRRRAFFKALDKLTEGGTAVVEAYPGLSGEDRDWRDKAETLAASEFRAMGRKPVGDALARLVDQVGPNARQLVSEVQKVATYVGERLEVGVEDVEAVVSKGRQAQAFALGDAVGERQLGRALSCLADELWAMQSDRQKSEIGLLYGLIGKMRAMVLAREMVEEGMLRVTTDYRNFTGQLQRLSGESFSKDRKFNPLAMNGYVLFRAMHHSMRYTREELVGAMELLLNCNRQLVGSTLDDGFLLEWVITRIVGEGVRTGERARPAPRLDEGRRRA